jgi:hypothetical protein
MVFGPLSLVLVLVLVLEPKRGDSGTVSTGTTIRCLGCRTDYRTERLAEGQETALKTIGEAGDGTGSTYACREDAAKKIEDEDKDETGANSVGKGVWGNGRCE